MRADCDRSPVLKMMIALAGVETGDSRLGDAAAPGSDDCGDPAEDECEAEGAAVL